MPEPIETLITIGILAYNEEKYIGRTLKELCSQQVLQKPYIDNRRINWELIIVPNGCTDNTAKIADDTLRSITKSFNDSTRLLYKICEIKTAGKSNAWNQLIHKFSNKNTEYFILIDADITFHDNLTIFHALNEIFTNNKCKVVVSTPIKQFDKNSKRNIIEWMSCKYSELKQKKQKEKRNPGIAGSFYCAEAKLLRQIWMPVGLSGEDGFLRAMISTNLFREPPDTSVIVRAYQAKHIYEGLSSIKELFHHELRMVIGTALNCYLCWDFLKFATDPKGPGAGYLIKNQLENNPNWYNELMKNSIKNRGFWVLPKGLLTRRFSNLYADSLYTRVVKIFIALLAFLFDIPVLITANQKLKKDAIGYW